MERPATMVRSRNILAVCRNLFGLGVKVGFVTANLSSSSTKLRTLTSCCLNLLSISFSERPMRGKRLIAGLVFAIGFDSWGITGAVWSSKFTAFLKVVFSRASIFLIFWAIAG